MAQKKEVLEVADTDLDGNELVVVKAVRKDGECMLYLRLDEKICDLLHTGHTATSSNWTDADGNGYKFHQKSRYDDKVREVMSSYYDDYGAKYAHRENGNVALLRTEGVQDGMFFDMDNPLTEEHLKQIVHDIKGAVDELRNQFLKDVVVVGEIRELDVQDTQST